MNNASSSFELALFTTIAQLVPGKEAIAPSPEHDYICLPRSVAPAPSSLAGFDSFSTPHKRPRLMSNESSASSVPSLASGPSTASFTSLLTPSRLDDLSPTYCDRSPLDPGLFAAMQDAYLGEQEQQHKGDIPVMSGGGGGSLPASPAGAGHLSLAHSPPRKHAALPVRRSSTLSPKSGPSLASPARAPRPPPLDLTGLSSMMGVGQAPRRVTAAPMARPHTAIGMNEDLGRVMREINSMVSHAENSKGVMQHAPVVPASQPVYQPPLPQYNVSGVSLGLNDLEMLNAPLPPQPQSAPAWTTTFSPDSRSLPASAPAFELGDPFGAQSYASGAGVVSAANYYLAAPPMPYSTSYQQIPQRRPSPPVVPLPHRPHSAPYGVMESASRRSSAPVRSTQRKTSFVNFTSKDATKLLNGVAPSGSSKRKREEEEARRGEKRRAVSA